MRIPFIRTEFAVGEEVRGRTFRVIDPYNKHNENCVIGDREDGWKYNTISDKEFGSALKLWKTIYKYKHRKYPPTIR